MSTSNLFGIAEDALNIYSKRADILANNLVNSSTPNFKARDFDFKRILSEKQNLANANPDPVAGALSHSEGLNPYLQYRIPNQPSIDGNTVDLDIERVKFIENAMHYEVSLNAINSQSQKLIRAFRGE